MTNITLVGCGALGSFLALNLPAEGHDFWLVDHDRIGPENVINSAYGHHLRGVPKVEAAAEILYRRGGQVRTFNERLTERNRMNLCAGRLVLDCLDNWASRRLTRGFETLHAGVAADLSGLVMWTGFPFPPDSAPTGNPVCTNALGRPIIVVTAAAATLAVMHFMGTGNRLEFSTSPTGGICPL